MRTNPVKEKLRRGEVSFGTWLSLGDLYATRVLARMGFDWLTLDIEHSAIDWSQATTIFGAIADAGCVPLARVPEGSHHYIKRVLDAGAYGIVVPMVDTVEQAKIAIAAAKYPPVEIGQSAARCTRELRCHRRRLLQTRQRRDSRGAADRISGGGRQRRRHLQPAGCRRHFRRSERPDIPNARSRRNRPVEGGARGSLAAHFEGGQESRHAGRAARANAEAVNKRIAEGWQFLAIASELKMMVNEAQRLATALGLKREAGDLARY
jgi:4-hydroxy-2-oxoheptanedioate aldolase